MSRRELSGLARVAVLALVAVAAAGPAFAKEAATDSETEIRAIHDLHVAGRCREAATKAASLVASNPHLLAAHVALQDAHVALGKRDEMITRYAERAGRDGAGADDVYLHARLLAGTQRIAAFRRVLRIEPAHFWSLCGLGAEFLENGRLRQARDALVAAVDADKTSAVPLNLLGRVAEQGGEPEEAETRYRAAIEANVDMVEPRVNLGVLLADTGRRDESRTVIDDAVKRHPKSPLARVSRGMLRMSWNESEKAVEDFEAALEVDRDDVVTLDFLAQAYLNLDRLDLAETALGRAQKIDADHAPTAVLLAYLWIAKEDDEAALAAAERAAVLDDELAQAHHMVGVCQERLGRAKKAEKAFDRAVKLDPDSPFFVRALALLYEAQGRHRDAVRGVREGRGPDRRRPRLAVRPGHGGVDARQGGQGGARARAGGRRRSGPPRRLAQPRPPLPPPPEEEAARPQGVPDVSRQGRQGHTRGGLARRALTQRRERDLP